MKIFHRAKENDNWVYGLYAGVDDFIVINEKKPRVAKIFTGTVGIYIGKYCKETKKPIFTGDIVRNYMGDLFVVVYDDHTCSFRLRSSLIYKSNRAIDGGLTIVGNTIDNDFIEPDERKSEATSVTPTSQSSHRRSHKEAMRGIGK